jgi:putative SOS response-associated peptidase YedK
MCNDYERNTSAGHGYCAMMQAAELGIPGGLNLPQADDIRINDLGPVMRASGNIIELIPMNFSFPPAGRGGPVFNFKSEGRHFDKSNRCLIPATAFFEFTGKKYPKAKHRFTLKGAHSLPLPASGVTTTVTHRPPLRCSPCHRVLEPYHSRQLVVLPPADWAAWIYLTKPEKDLLRPLPKGSLDVRTVREGSD